MEERHQKLYHAVEVDPKQITQEVWPYQDKLYIVDGEELAYAPSNKHENSIRAEITTRKSKWISYLIPVGDLWYRAGKQIQIAGFDPPKNCQRDWEKVGTEDNYRWVHKT